ncbi:MAG: hypothetical protein KJZ93_22795 [Caldilineaceae bacterium]|nr:hypothetical protein [Caldilineaceae bacterium]
MKSQKSTFILKIRVPFSSLSVNAGHNDWYENSTEQRNTEYGAVYPSYQNTAKNVIAHSVDKTFCASAVRSHFPQPWKGASEIRGNLR